MAKLQPLYRITVYGPDGVTVLTPRAGAAHSDAFQLSTERSPAAPWKPYMMAPEGRRGRFDRLTCNAELGEIIVPVLDQRVSDNSTRFITAFTGDDRGRVQMKGCTAFIERSIDGGAWAPYYHGRITHIGAPEPTKAGPVIRLTILDHRVDEFRNVFTGAPHRSVTYAKPARLWPLGLPEMENGKGWAGFPATPPAFGLIAEDGAADASVLLLTSSSPSNTVNREQHNFRITEALATALDGAQNAGPRVAMPVGAPATRGPARLWMKRRDTSAEGWFLLRHVYRPKQTGYNGSDISVAFLSENGNLLEVGIEALPLDHPQYMAVPPSGTFIDYEIYRTGEPTPDAPLMIHDVHPVTFWKDLYAGYFGDLAYDTVDGVKDEAGVLIAKGERVRTPIAIDAASFAALEADDSLPHVTTQITSSADLGEFLRDQLFAVVHVGAQVRGDAKIYAADLRIPSSTLGLPLLTRAEYVSADWEAGDDAKTAIVVRYPRFWSDSTASDVLSKDPKEFPRVPVTRLAGREERDVTLTDLYALMPVAEHTISAAVFPATPVPRFFPVRESAERYKDAARPYVSLYGTGAQYLELTTRFVAGLTDDIWPLEWIRVNVPPPPNPSNNLRGGERVFLVLQREDQRNGMIRFRLLDAGPDAIAVAPSFGAVTLSVSRPKHAIDFALNLNVSDELAQVDYIITETSVGVRPADTDAGWRMALQTDVDAATSIDRLPSGKRVWLRARSIPAGKIASSYIYAASIDTQALAAPTGLAASVTGRSIALSWTNAESAYRIMPLQALSPGPALPYLVTPLAAGSTRTVFEDLVAGTHVVGVQYVDEFGGSSPAATVSAATAAALQLATPRRVWFLQSASAPVSSGVPTPAGSPGTGVHVAIDRAAVHTFARVQVATDAAFTNIVLDLAMPPGVFDVLLLTPLDSVLRYVRAREEREGYADSLWSATLTSYPTILVRDPGAGRNPLADEAIVTPDDYRADPALRIDYGAGITQIRVTVPGGRTKTWSGLSGGGSLTYVVGIALDDATTENLLVTGETRDPYIVEAFAGATARTVFHGPLHGLVDTSAGDFGNPPFADPHYRPHGSNYTTALVEYSGGLGTGGTGPLDWRRRIDDEAGGIGVWGPGAGDGWVSGAVGSLHELPYQEDIPRPQRDAKTVWLQVRDANGQMSPPIALHIGSEYTRDPKYPEQAIQPSQNLLGRDAIATKAFGSEGAAADYVTLSQIEAEEGDIFSASADVKNNISGDVERELRIRCLDASGAFLEFLTGGSRTNSTSYTRLTIEGKAIPAGTARIEVYVDNVGTPASSFSVRRAMLNRGPAAIPYEHPPFRPNRETFDDLDDGVTYKRPTHKEVAQATSPSQNLWGPDARDPAASNRASAGVGTSHLAKTLEQLGVQVGDVISLSGRAATTGAAEANVWLEFEGSSAVVHEGNQVSGSGTSKLEGLVIPVGTTSIDIRMRQSGTGTSDINYWMLNRGPVALPYEDPPFRKARETIDDVDDGTTHKKTTGDEKTGAGRGFNALDTINRLKTGWTAIATDGGGRIADRFLAKSLVADVDSLDGLPEGTTYKRTTGNEKTGASRAFGALESTTVVAAAVQKKDNSGVTKFIVVSESRSEVLQATITKIASGTCTAGDGMILRVGWTLSDETNWTGHEIRVYRVVDGTPGGTAIFSTSTFSTASHDDEFEFQPFNKLGGGTQEVSYVVKIVRTTDSVVMSEKQTATFRHDYTLCA